MNFSPACCCRNNLSLHCTYVQGKNVLFQAVFNYLASLVLLFCFVFFKLRPRSNAVFKVLKLNISAYFQNVFSSLFLTASQMSLDFINPQVIFTIQPQLYYNKAYCNIYKYI